MSVDLCRRDVGVAQQFLDRSQVSPATQHVGGKTVPQGMRSNRHIQLGRFRVTLEYLPEALPGQSLPAAIEEKGLPLIIMRQVGASFFHIFFHG